MTAISDEVNRAVRLGTLATYSVGVWWIELRTGAPTDLWWWLLEIPFFLWTVAPIGVPLLLRMRSWVLTGGVALMAAYGLYVYDRDMFGPGARSTSALIFICLPLYQWVGTIVLVGITSVLNRKTSS